METTRVHFTDLADPVLLEYLELAATRNPDAEEIYVEADIPEGEIQGGTTYDVRIMVSVSTEREAVVEEDLWAHGYEITI
jgi:hypothetical protein